MTYLLSATAGLCFGVGLHALIYGPPWRTVVGFVFAAVLMVYNFDRLHAAGKI